MLGKFEEHLKDKIAQIKSEGLWKDERVIASPQQARIDVGGAKVLNLCANNYLGLSDHPEVVRAAAEGLENRGYGLSSVRFICGTQDIHKQLEKELSGFLGMEDALLYGSCFDANGGLFETLLEAGDAVVSDALNHASIIDGIRLCKATRYRYANSNMQELEAALRAAHKEGSRFRLIATDGVFSMDGYYAKLAEICDLAEKYDAMVMVDDSHAVGFVGQHGRGTHELCGVMDRVDIITGTLGKALGGASGGYTSGSRVIVEFLRQRSRPYLFSNSVAPAVVAASLKALELTRRTPELRERLQENTRCFREQMTAAGFRLLPGTHPIVPIMLGDAALAKRLADLMLAKGVYVIGFSYPVVPKGQARIRTQISAAHSRADIDFAVKAFREAKAELGI